MELLEFKKELSKHIDNGKLDTFGSIMLCLFAYSLSIYLVKNWRYLIHESTKGE